MSIRGFDHVQLAIPAGGEARARSYYGDLLGLREVRKPEPLAARGGCWFEAPGLRLHLGVAGQFQPARKAHPALLVDDLDSLKARLEAAGEQVEVGRSVAGVRRFYSADPFGNRLEFIQLGDQPGLRAAEQTEHAAPDQPSPA